MQHTPLAGIFKDICLGKLMEASLIFSTKPEEIYTHFTDSFIE
jgi:hypothetical protein